MPKQPQFELIERDGNVPPFFPPINVIHMCLARAVQELNDDRDFVRGVLDRHQPEEVGIVLLNRIVAVLVSDDETCGALHDFRTH